jgi:hypothetical protein
LAALVELALLEPVPPFTAKVDNLRWTLALPQVGQLTSEILLALRTNFSKGC